MNSGPGQAAATVVLKPDGTFVAMDLPGLQEPSTADIQAGRVNDDTQVNWSRLSNGSGTWSIHDDRDGSAPAVELHFDNNSDASVDYESLLSLSVHGSLRLFVAVGDADAKYRFIFTRTGRPTLSRGGGRVVGVWQPHADVTRIL